MAAEFEALDDSIEAIRALTAELRQMRERQAWRESASRHPASHVLGPRESPCVVLPFPSQGRRAG
jgi:hypothetical protein